MKMWNQKVSDAVNVSEEENVSDIVNVSDDINSHSHKAQIIS